MISRWSWLDLGLIIGSKLNCSSSVDIVKGIDWLYARQAHEVCVTMFEDGWSSCLLAAITSSTHRLKQFRKCLHQTLARLHWSLQSWLITGDVQLLLIASPAVFHPCRYQDGFKIDDAYQTYVLLVACRAWATERSSRCFIPSHKTYCRLLCEVLKCKMLHLSYFPYCPCGIFLV